MTYPVAAGVAVSEWAAIVEEVISGKSDLALQIGTKSVDGQLAAALKYNGIDAPQTVQALDAATRNLFSDLSACAQNMANALLQLRSDTANAMSNPDWSNAYRTRQVVAAREKAQQALDDIQATAIKTAATIRKQIDPILAGPAANSDPSVAEMQIAGAWSVAQPFLGGAVTGDSIQKLVNMNIPGMTAALRRYLPLTIMAMQAGAPQQHIDQFVESALLQLDAAELPTLGKASRRARELNAQLLVAIGRLQSAYLLACQEVTGQQRQNVLPGPDGAVPVVDPQLR
jgi:hypothetical protein